MSYYMELQFGLWNAWLGTVLTFITQMVFMMINKKARKRLADMSWYNSGEKTTAYVSMFFMYALIIFAFWVPLKSGSAWFYTGTAIYAVSFVLNLVAVHNYATTPENTAVTKGLYRFSRNPLYLFFSTMMLGICIASASLPMTVLWIVYNIPVHLVILAEERYCLRTYGDSYKDFMKEVPRYFLVF